MAGPVTLTLDPQLSARAHALARAREFSIQQLLKDALRSEIVRAQTPAKTPNRADERLVARLQRLLAPDMATAQGWADLHARLARHGVELRPAGGGLTLHRKPGGQRLCKASELGFAYARLVRRFGAPMPGHPHRMDHLRPITDTAPPPSQDDGDLEVIERV